MQPVHFFFLLKWQFFGKERPFVNATIPTATNNYIHTHMAHLKGPNMTGNLQDLNMSFVLLHLIHVLCVKLFLYTVAYQRWRTCHNLHL